MKHVAVPMLLAFVLTGCGSPGTPPSMEELIRSQAQEEYEEAAMILGHSDSSSVQFHALGSAAKGAFVVGRPDEALGYAQELLELAPRFKGDWNYGNAIHDGNLVLGRVAVKEGRLDDARQYLLAAGKTPGSPQLDTFGPNMSLAKDLLEAGEKESVLQYFDLCKQFWKMGGGDLSRWSRSVKWGGTPDFGGNLLF